MRKVPKLGANLCVFLLFFERGKGVFVMKFLLRYVLLCVLLFGVGQVAEAQKRKKSNSSKKKKKGKKGKKRSKSSRKKKKGKKGKLSKKERKADLKKWKKKLKKVKPLQYKKLMKEYTSLKKQVQKSKESVAECESNSAKNAKLVGDYQKQITTLRKEKKAGATQAGGQGLRSPSLKGTTFRIQIGNYAQINLSQFAGQSNFNVEQDGNTQKFTVGLFKSYREADTLKKYLRKMGVKDAWVVAYQDGKRVNLRDVVTQAVGGK